jgi:glucose-6-phosphate dehydrogenase assembly protein OpcA
MASPVSSGQVSESVAYVERELAKIWAAPDPSTGADASTKVRASTMNLAVVTSPSELDHERASTDDLSQTHAGRVFLVTLDGRIAPWDLGAAVSAVCRAEGGAAICSDRIELAFGASAATRAASVVAALAIAEVPLVVEAAPGAPSILVDDLAKRADRVIVDSALVPVVRLAEIARETSAPLADRAWVRTFTWRELVARFFDEAPEDVRRIRRVEIAHTPGSKGEVHAILLGWLGSRLGWRFESRGRAVSASGEGIELAVVEEPRSGLEPGQVVAIRLGADVAGGRVDLAVERTEVIRTVRWSMRGAKSAEHMHPLGFRDETWVAGKALDDRACDAVYRATVVAAAEWCAL